MTRCLFFLYFNCFLGVFESFDHIRFELESNNSLETLLTLSMKTSWFLIELVIIKINQVKPNKSSGLINQDFMFIIKNKVASYLK